jgi:hypothetical protein
MDEPMFDENLDEPGFLKGGLPSELDAKVRAELRFGEVLLWSGQPNPAYFARRALPAAIIGAVVTTISLLFFLHHVWESLTVGRKGGVDHGGAESWIVIGLFSLIGLGLMSAPFWERRNAKRTCYALTDRRAIVWEAEYSGEVEVRSFRPEDLNRVYRVENHRGGDLVFEEEYSIKQNSDRADDITITKRHGFMGIDGVREVEELVRTTLLPDKE